MATMTLFVKWLNRAPIGRSSVRSSYQTRPVLNKRLWLALPIWLIGGVPVLIIVLQTWTLAFLGVTSSIFSYLSQKGTHFII